MGQRKWKGWKSGEREIGILPPPLLSVKEGTFIQMHPVTLILRLYCNSQNTIHMCKHCLCRLTHEVDMTTDTH